VIESINERNSLRVEDMNTRRKARFDRLDLNDDSVLSPEEIDTLVNRINEHHHVSLDPGAFAAELDRDGNGQVSFDEFGNLRKVIDLPRASRMPWGRGERLFERLDADESGGVSDSEMNGFITRVNEQSGKSFATEEVMTALDKNEDGVITKEEMRGLRRVMGPPSKPVISHNAKNADDIAADEVRAQNLGSPDMTVPDAAILDTEPQNTSSIDVSA
jgi:Ca2+-binding EF-hand superfamily protein